MNEKLMAKLLEYLNNGEAFLKEQAPEYVRQALTYYAWDAQFSAWIALGFALVFLFISVPCALNAFYEDNAGTGIISFFTFFGFFGCVICMTASYSTLKKIELAPKVFLVEMLTPGVCKK